MLSRPKCPLVIVDGPCVRNLEPVPLVAPKILKVVIGGPREVHLAGAGMPEDSILAAAVPGDAEANFGAGEHVGCLGRSGRLERVPPAGDVSAVYISLRRSLKEVVSRGILARCVRPLRRYVADVFP
jgi:hypothetical protein